ncbi:protein kinase [Stieleria sp. TO1_6]|uniref:protein kinase domain-containing protein n=1 Tax=Stieleria tagensis TaxID=2956795 RepID=UPI00209A94F6|nr:protein kinase [Stieleria tagensis]MCO8122425.1 protein kinase [Stieleria tagensis]
MQLQSGQEIVPGYTLVKRLGGGMAGEAWSAKAPGGVMVAIKLVAELKRLGGQRELRALRTIQGARHPNLCPIFGFWLLDEDGSVLKSELLQLELESSVDTKQPNPEPSISQGAISQGTMQLPEAADTGDGESPDAALDRNPNQSSVGIQQADSEPENVEQSSRSTSGASIDETDEADDSESAVLTLTAAIRQASAMVIAMGLGDKTLADHLDEAQQESPEPCGIERQELLRYMAAAAEAIDHLNTRHAIYHCDIKPQNLLLVGGQVQVCDFGLARRVEEDSRMTQKVFGSPAYGAPEMLMNRTYSETIDQYSLAISFYELRTGRLPYSELSQAAILIAKSTSEFDFSGVTPSEKKALIKATRLQPEARFGTCREFVDAMRPHASMTDSAAGPGHVVRMCIAMLLGVVLTFGAGYWWFDLRPRAAENNDQASVTPLPQPLPQPDPKTPPDETPKVIAAADDPPDPQSMAAQQRQQQAPRQQQTGRQLAMELAAVEDQLAVAPWPPTERWVPTPQIDRAIADGTLVGADQNEPQRLLLYRQLADLTAKQHPDELTKWLQSAGMDQTPPAVLQAWADTFAAQLLAASPLPVAPLLQQRSTIQKLAADHSLQWPTDLDRGMILSLIADRIESKSAEQSDQSLSQAAERLRSRVSDDPLAIAAARLVDHGRVGQTATMGPAVLPTELPFLTDRVEPSYQFGRAWQAYASGDRERAMEIWSDASRDSATMDQLARRDRLAVAQQLVDDLIQQTSVADQQSNALRYANPETDAQAWRGTVVSTLKLARELAADESTMDDRVRHEMFLWNVAQNDLLRAAEMDVALKLQTPQTDSARLALYRGLLNRGRLDPTDQQTWLPRLIAAAVRLIEYENSAVSGNGDDSTRHSSQQRVTEVLLPVIRLIEPVVDRGTTRMPTVPRWLNPDHCGQLCLWYAQTGNQFRYVSQFQTYVQWLRSIEIASAVAAQWSSDPQTTAAMTRQCVEASIQEVYEGDDDQSVKDVIALLQQYEQLLPTISADSSSPALVDQWYVHGRVADQVGFLSRNESQRLAHYQTAQSTFQKVIDHSADSSLEPASGAAGIGEAKRCLAALLDRIAASADSNQESLRLRDRAIELAEQAVAAPEAWHNDADDRLRALAIPLRNRAIAMASTAARQNDAQEGGLPAVLALFDRASAALDKAISIRQKQNLLAVSLQIDALETLTVKLQTLTGQSNSSVDQEQRDLIRSVQNSAQQLIQSISIDEDGIQELKTPDLSMATQGNWHVTAGRFYAASGKLPLACDHFEKVRSLDRASDFLPSAISQLASIQLCQTLIAMLQATEDVDQRSRLADRITETLDRIQDPYPSVRRECILLTIDLAAITQDYKQIAKWFKDAIEFYRNHPTPQRSGLVAICALNAQRGLMLKPGLTNGQQADCRNQLERALAALPENAADPLERIHRLITEACAEVGVRRNDPLALENVVSALRLYDKAMPLHEMERSLRAITQDFLLVAICQRLKSERKSIAIATDALKQVRKEYPSAAALIDQLL